MADKKIALIIGNDNYHSSGKLTTAVRDARDMNSLLGSHENEDTNFKIQCPGEDVSNEYIQNQITLLLSREEALQHVLFYFSGHGFSDESGAYICGVDTDIENENKGVPFSWIAKRINTSIIPEVTVIFDCCFAGAMFNCTKIKEEIGVLRRGVTFLGATMRNDLSQGAFKNGLFTSIIKAGLEGGSKDLYGSVSASSLYQLADRTLGASEQRPVFKSCVKNSAILRQCHPLISIPELKKIILPPYFKRIDNNINLSPDILTGEQSSLYMNYEELLLFEKFERIGLLSSDHGYSLARLNEWPRFYLSSYGELIWNRVKYKQL